MTSADFPAPSARPARTILVLALAPAIGLGIGRFAYSLVLPDMRDSLGWSYSTAGFMNTVNAIGYLGGNFFAWRYSSWYGIDRMIWWGLLISIGGLVLSLSLTGFFPQIGPAALFIPQLIISLGNGLLLPNSFAGAVSVRPQAAGAASGIAGFGQMALGAAAAQFATTVLAGATGALPLAITMAVILVAATAAYLVLVRPKMLTGPD